MKFSIKTTHHDFLRALRVAMLRYRDKATEQSQGNAPDGTKGKRP